MNRASRALPWAAAAGLVRLAIACVDPDTVGGDARDAGHDPLDGSVTSQPGSGGSDASRRPDATSAADAAADASADASPRETGRLVFAAKLGGAASLELYSVAPDGSDLVQITDTAGQDELHPRWSPDRARVAYVRGVDVVVSDASGTSPTVVATTPAVFRSAAAWSPDGLRLLYQHRREPWLVGPDGDDESGLAVLHVVGVDGTGDVELAPLKWPPVTAFQPSQTHLQPVWSATGRITFMRGDWCLDCAGGEDWVSMNEDGSGFQYVADSYARRAIAASHDGSRWAWVEPSWGAGGCRSSDAYECRGAVVVAEAEPGAGAARKVLAASGAWQPRWSPSGAFVAYLRDDGIYVVPAAGGPELRIFAASGIRGLDW